MWHRALVTALALTYLICVLSLSGVQKEDLDVNTLKKLKQHNVNLDDLNNETLHRDCLMNADVELSSNKQTQSADLATTSMHPMVTESTLHNSKQLEFTELPDIDNVIKYFKTAPGQAVRKVNIEVHGAMLKDVNKDDNVVTTIAPATTNGNVADNNSLLNPENLMKFWSMYAHFQQSQNQVNKIQNEPTTTTPEVKPKTEKNNIFHITINKYTRNESFLEHYFDSHHNKTAQIKKTELASKHIMEKIHDFISNKLFANEDELSKEVPNLNVHVTRRENPSNKANEEQRDAQSIRSGLEAFGHESTKTVLDKIPPQTLEDIATEVQDLVMRGLIKSTSKPFTQISHNVEKETDKVPTKLLQSVVDSVKKMLLSELWKDSGSKGSSTTSTDKTVTAKTTVTTKKPESTDPEFSKFIKLFKKFKSWRETVTSSSKEDLESAKLGDQLKNTEAAYKSHEVKTHKLKGKLKALRFDNAKSLEFNDSRTYSDPVNPYGYPNYHEKNVITDDEDQQTENTFNLAQFPLPYRVFHSGNKYVKTNTNVDGSIERKNFKQPLQPVPKNEKTKHHFRNKHTRHKSMHRSETKFNIKEEPSSISMETKYSANNTSTEYLIKKDYMEGKTHGKGLYSNAASEYSTNNKNKNSDDEESLSSESNGNFRRELVLNSASGKRKEAATFISKYPESSKTNDPYGNQPNQSAKNLDAEEENEMATNSKTQFHVVNTYGSSNHPDQNIIVDGKSANAYSLASKAQVKLLDSNSGFQDEERKLNLRAGYHSYVAKSYTKSPKIEGKNVNLAEHNSNIASIHNQNTDQNKDESNQGEMRNIPSSAYNSYSDSSYSGQNKWQGNIPNENQMPPYPYGNPDFSTIRKFVGVQNTPDIPKAYLEAALSTYVGPNSPSINNIVPQQHKIRGVDVNHISETSYPAAPNYSKRNNIGENQYHGGYQDAPNYSSQNNIGSIQEQTSGNIPIPNSVAAYPYAFPQYSEKNKPRGTSDSRSAPMHIPNPIASYNIYSAPIHSANNMIGETQSLIQAGSVSNPNSNVAMASLFGGIFAAKEKFPVIQDPRVEALMKNPNLNTGPSLSPYTSTNVQGPLTALQNPNMRKNQDNVAQSLVPNTFNEANIRGIGLQSIPFAKQPLPYREGSEVAAPSMFLQSMQGVSFPKLDNVMAQNNPVVNGQPVTVPAYTAHQQPDITAPPPSDAKIPKQKVTQSNQRTQDENSFNTIAKIYPQESTQKKIKDDQSSPIMMQTNDDEIMPLGIPIHIKGESKFHMRMIQNQHIIVTTTARPKSKAKDWNDYRLSKDTRSHVEKKKPLQSQPITSYHQERVRPPMTHHDFEDLQPSLGPNDQRNHYRDEPMGMRPRSEQEFEPRHLHQYVPESMPAKRPRYNPERMEDRYPRHRYEKPVKASLYREQEKMHDSINAGQQTIAQRHQLPLKRPQMNFDDTHFNNFLKTQEKVNDMLERILSTRPKNLSLEPIKDDN